MKTVVFGAGYWGRNYVRELASNAVALIDTDERAASYVTRTYGIKSYPELPRDLDYDAAIIVTPPETHVDLALPILKSGKYVMIEKPLAVSVEDAMRLYPYRSRCMAAHIYLYHPAIEWMRDWMQDHVVDHVFSRRTNAGPVRTSVSALWDLAVHDVSIFNHLFGKPLSVEATGVRDWSILRVNYVGVSTATYVSWFGNPKMRTVEFVPIQHDGDRYIFDDLMWVFEISPLRHMLDAFLSGHWERCTLDEGIEVLQVLEAAGV